MWVVIIRTVHCVVSNWTLFSAVSIRDAFKQVLMKHIGKDWCQLAIQMGLPKMPIHDIQERHDRSLQWKISTFLEEYKFPSFERDAETMEFLLETLQRTSLSDIVVDVKRELEHDLHIQGTQFSVYGVCYSFIPQETTCLASLSFARLSISCIVHP